jgi:uncharacterized protein involved in tolerance to divalent cations
MKSAAKFSLVLVTAPDLKTARTLAKAALKAKLIACANIIPKIESHHWWQGKIESGAEVLLILKAPKTGWQRWKNWSWPGIRTIRPSFWRCR